MCHHLEGALIVIFLVLIFQIDYYEALYVEISKFENLKVFNGWFRVDIKLFKVSLLNTLKKWSWLFKEHLLTHVTDR